MDDWERVTKTELDEKAHELYAQKGNKENYCDLKGVAIRKSKVELLAFLRYDYKKVLIRTRYLYIDRLRRDQLTIKGSDMDYAFFEPILLCFPNLEFIGRINFSDVVNWSPTAPKTGEILHKILEKIGGGYNAYAQNLVNLHRHALSHELRPDGNWKYDLNTEDKYWTYPVNWAT